MQQLLIQRKISEKNVKKLTKNCHSIKFYECYDNKLPQFVPLETRIVRRKSLPKLPERQGFIIRKSEEGEKIPLNIHLSNYLTLFKKENKMLSATC